MESPHCRYKSNAFTLFPVVKQCILKFDYCMKKLHYNICYDAFDFGVQNNNNFLK